MEVRLFRKEILESRFRRSTEVVTIEGFGPVALLVVGMIVLWVLFFCGLTVNDYVLNERFVGVVTTDSDRYLDAKRYPSVKTIGMILIPVSSSSDVREGSKVEVSLFGKEFAGLPPIRATIVRIIKADDPAGAPIGGTHNAIGIAAFPPGNYLDGSDRVSQEKGTFFNAHIRTKQVSLLELMLAPAYKLTSK